MLFQCAPPSFVCSLHYGLENCFLQFLWHTTIVISNSCMLFWWWVCVGVGGLSLMLCLKFNFRRHVPLDIWGWLLDIHNDLLAAEFWVQHTHLFLLCDKKGVALCFVLLLFPSSGCKRFQQCPKVNSFCCSPRSLRVCYMKELEEKSPGGFCDSLATAAALSQPHIIRKAGSGLPSVFIMSTYWIQGK